MTPAHAVIPSDAVILSGCCLTWARMPRQSAIGTGVWNKLPSCCVQIRIRQVSGTERLNN